MGNSHDPKGSIFGHSFGHWNLGAVSGTGFHLLGLVEKPGLDSLSLPGVENASLHIRLLGVGEGTIYLLSAFVSPWEETEAPMH